MPAAAVLKVILEKNAQSGPSVGPAKPPAKGALATIKASPVRSIAAMLAAGGGSYMGGKAVLGDSLAKEVDRQGNSPIVQGAADLLDKGEAAGKAVGDRAADPFKGALGTDPNTLPAKKPESGVLEGYWNKLKSGDTATVAGTGAAALLAAVLTHNLLKKRGKR